MDLRGMTAWDVFRYTLAARCAWSPVSQAPVCWWQRGLLPEDSHGAFRTTESEGQAGQLARCGCETQRLGFVL